jgi:hypothetical protein
VITAAAASLEVDLTGVAGTFTLDFLSVGAPAKDDSDRIGTVVATRWGNGAVPGARWGRLTAESSVSFVVGQLRVESPSVTPPQ